MCLFPTRASLNPEGGRPLLSSEGNLVLPCGKCRECISKRAMDWSLRARHEMSLHKENCFLTLTYAPEHLKSHFIVKPDFQKFVKLLRYHTDRNIRYMVSYEYGTQYFRPHMHAIIFGYSPKKLKFFKNSKGGHALYTSDEITKLWKHGFHSIGDANEKTAYYIASYALSGTARTVTHPNTGESIELRDCMDVSKRPAIGHNYLLQNSRQLVESGAPMPRYYLKKLQKLNPTLHEHYENTTLSALTSRSSYELYAKFVIGEAKSCLTDSEFRDIPDDLKIKKAQELLLEQNRDDYHRKAKK